VEEGWDSGQDRERGRDPAGEKRQDLKSSFWLEVVPRAGGCLGSFAVTLLCRFLSGRFRLGNCPLMFRCFGLSGSLLSEFSGACNTSKIQLIFPPVAKNSEGWGTRRSLAGKSGDACTIAKLPYRLRQRLLLRMWGLFEVFGSFRFLGSLGFSGRRFLYGGRPAQWELGFMPVEK
jgi:hypothetical protein